MFNVSLHCFAQVPQLCGRTAVYSYWGQAYVAGICHLRGFCYYFL